MILKTKDVYKIVNGVYNSHLFKNDEIFIPDIIKQNAVINLLNIGIIPSIDGTPIEPIKINDTGLFVLENDKRLVLGVYRGRIKYKILENKNENVFIVFNEFMRPNNGVYVNKLKNEYKHLTDEVLSNFNIDLGFIKSLEMCNIQLFYNRIRIKKKYDKHGVKI